MTNYKRTFRPRLVAQEPERENGKLFDLDRGEFIEEPPCDHRGGRANERK